MQRQRARKPNYTCEPAASVQTLSCALICAAFTAVILTAGAARADCFFHHHSLPGDSAPPAAGTPPTALHALTAIRAATGASRCKPCTCDVDSSGTITPTDALRILQRAVGLNISLACPATCHPLCGDRIVDTPIEECDDGTSTSSCDENCTLAVCGDGFRNEAAGEQCDRGGADAICDACLLYTSPSPRDRTRSRMPSSA